MIRSALNPVGISAVFNQKTNSGAEGRTGSGRPTFDQLKELAEQKKRAAAAVNFPLRAVVFSGNPSRLSCGHEVARYAAWAARCRECGPKKPEHRFYGEDVK